MRAESAKCILIPLILASSNASADRIPIILSNAASGTQRLAAGELQHFLGRIHPADEFTISNAAPDTLATRSIRIGTITSQPELADYLAGKRPGGPEGYVVASQLRDGRRTAVIVGADDAGVMNGVYGLLEKLGCGFYLTGEVLPAPREETTDLSAWDLADHPLVGTRLVFNWHNFLSGCTGWNLEHWQQWVSNSQRMGFNTVMVHAYGNNPMFSFDFNGMTKPIGYYGTSRKGRDWGRQHVNDVRRLPGGEIFDGPEFGSAAALVPDEQRVDAARSLMRRVFAHAEGRGMRVAFAIDVDIVSVLPQEMILSLPEEARMHNGSLWLPRPDSGAGYLFYKAQVDALLESYPQIDTLALWRRDHGQEWGKYKEAGQLPRDWRAEYQAHIEKHPEAANLPQAVCASP